MKTIQKPSKKSINKASRNTRLIIGQAVLTTGFVAYVADQLQAQYQYGALFAVAIAFMVLYFTNKK